MKPLYIADDYGFTPSIDRAIVALAEQGAIDGASVLVTTRDLAHADALRRLPRLQVGLHLCLTWGHPASPAKQLGSLVRADGTFGGLGRLARVWASGRLRAEALRTEIAAQIEQLREHTGRVDFIDGHQHVQFLPDVCAALEEVLATQPAPMRVRFGRVRAGRLRHRLVLNALVGLRRARAAALAFESTALMVDYEDFDESSDCAQSTEVMLHVAHPDVLERGLDSTSYDFAGRVAQFRRRAAAHAMQAVRARP